MLHTKLYRQTHTIAALAGGGAVAPVADVVLIALVEILLLRTCVVSRRLDVIALACEQDTFQMSLSYSAILSWLKDFAMLDIAESIAKQLTLAAATGALAEVASDHEVRPALVKVALFVAPVLAWRRVVTAQLCM